MARGIEEDGGGVKEGEGEVYLVAWFTDPYGATGQASGAVEM
jgi:hypothetical protein